MNIEEYSKFKQHYIDHIPEILLKYLQKNKGNSFLDLGCGDGLLLHALDAKGYFVGKDVFAVDLSKTRIDLIAKTLPAIKFFVDDACNLTHISPNQIDFLISSQVIEHVPDEEKMIKEIKKVLSPGGVAYISTIFKKWYGWYFYRCNGKWTIDPTHLREFKKDSELLDILKKEGFEILENKKTQEIRKIFGIKVPVPGYFIWEIVCKKP